MKREEILSGLRRHHRMHLSIDPTCSHAPDCAGCTIFDNARSALTREPAPRSHRELMEEAREALVRSSAYVHENRGDIVTDNQELAQRIDVALASAQPCAAPATDCKHREIARNLCQRLHTVECGVECTDLCRDAYRRIDWACAPGEAGEWERVAEAPVTDVGSSISTPVGASRGTHVLTVSGVKIHAGDRLSVYRRRAPEREGGAR